MRLSGCRLVGLGAEPGALANAEGVRLEPHLPPLGQRGGRWNDHRSVINGIVFRVRTGIPRRTCSHVSAAGRPSTNAHRHWSPDGTWESMHPDLMVDQPH
ncbi:transposase [Streptomyces justiciae]|uniref:transposase n=1 Tax=Streptomyces justiciae TaxID=2780140 RepID=UPI0018828065|nr:transposase [Streptomyces justiciae]MBE8476039.1 transposase [Streptomyces justiciae]